MKFPEYFSYLKDLSLVWFNPCWGYFGFWKRLLEFQNEQKIDFNTAWKHRDMKRNKELYAVAVTALCLQKEFPTEYGWWFTKPKQDPPDGLIATPVSDLEQNENIMHGREVEVVEYLGGSLIDTIQKKLSKKAYETNTILVCLLSPKEMEIIEFQTLSEQIQKMSLSLQYIFVVGGGCLISPTDFKKLTNEEKLKKLKEVFLIQLSPQYAVVSVSPEDSCKLFSEGKQSAWLKFQSINKGTGFREVKIDTPPELFS